MHNLPPFTLGHHVTSVRRIGPAEVAVTFASTYGDLYLHQLYIGRTLVGVTNEVYERQIFGQFFPGRYSEPIQILAIDPADRNVDYGAALPDRPYCRVKIRYSTEPMEPDTWLIEVSAGTEPEGAVDPANIVGREFYRGEGEFTVITDTLGPGGTWNFEVAGRDNKRSGGNRGTPLEISAAIQVIPPDFEAESPDERFEMEVEAGVLSLSYLLPTF